MPITPITPNLFESKKPPAGIIPNLFEGLKPTVIPDLFEPTKPDLPDLETRRASVLEKYPELGKKESPTKAFLKRLVIPAQEDIDRHMFKPDEINEEKPVPENKNIIPDLFEGKTNFKKALLLPGLSMIGEQNRFTYEKDILGSTGASKDLPYKPARMVPELRSRNKLNIKFEDIPSVTSFEAALYPYAQRAAGFVTKPFGIEPLKDFSGPEKIKAQKEHPIATAIGELLGYANIYAGVGKLFPQTLLGTTTTFAGVGGIEEIGRQKIEDSALEPKDGELLKVGEETLKGGALGPIWHYSNALKFVGRPVASAVTRAGVKGGGTVGVSSLFGDDLEESIKAGGLITGLSLIFESPYLAKTALGRQAIKEANRIAKEAKLPDEIRIVDIDKLDTQSARSSILDLANGLSKLMKIKGEPLPEAPKQITGEVKAPEAKPEVKPETPKLPAPSPTDKIGKTVGIDAETGLPIIDRTRKAEAQITKGYFTFDKAKNSLSINLSQLSDEKLQKHIVLLRDYNSYVNNSTPENTQRLIDGGYFKQMKSEAATGLSPKDQFMGQNIKTALDEAVQEKENRIITPIVEVAKPAEIVQPEKDLTQESIQEEQREEIQKQPPATKTVTVKQKAKIIKKAVEILPDDEGILRSLTEKIATGEAGKRIPTEEGYTGYSSTFPKYFQNKGYTKAGVLDIIGKVEKGQPLTVKQEAIFRDLMEGEKAEFKKEIDFYERRELEERKRLRAEGISESEIDNAIQSGEKAAQSEIDDEGVGEVSFEFGENVPTEKTPSGEQILIKGTEGKDVIDVGKGRGATTSTPQKEGDLLAEFKGETNEQMQKDLFEKPKAPAYQKGGTNASIGDYANLENLTDKKSGLPEYKRVPFPEIARIVKDLTGKYPNIKKYLYGARGRARPGSLDIDLLAKAFQEGPEAVAKFLSHELGHIFDFLPEGVGRKGNLLGRIASLHNYLKHFLAEFPGGLNNILTPKEKTRLLKEATALSAKPTTETREVVVGEKLPTPEEILAIWNTTTAGIDNPELMDYIKKLSDELKKDIVKAAFKSTIPKWVTFKKQVKETITVGVIRNAPEDIKRLYKELLRNEIIKRRLFDISVIRKELQALSAAWRPFDRIKSSPHYVEYRDKPEELYADAISVLFNDPVRLKTEAPEFYRGFFNYLDQKPQVAEEYYQIQNLLTRGSDDVNKARVEEIYKGFEEGREKRTEAFNKEIEKKSVLFKSVTQHVSKFHPIYHELNRAVKEGKISVTRKQVMRETLEAMAYKRNDVWLDLERNEKEVMEPLKKAGISENELGAWFMLERNLGDRIGIANPQGLIGEFNTEVKDFIFKNFTPEQSAVLKEAATNFHRATFEIAEQMHAQGMIPENVWKEKIVPYKDTYVSYGVVKYIEKNYVTPYVKSMAGTFEEIENPLVTTMYKRGSMLQALAVHKAKSQVVTLLKEIAPDEITQSKSVMGIKRQRIFQKAPGKGQIILQEKGDWISYDVDPYFEQMFKQFDPKDLHTLAFIAGQFNRVFKPVVTTYKIGWAVYNNPVRDTQRTLKNLAAISKIEGIPFSRLSFLKNWASSIPEGFKFAGGNLTPLAKEALGAHAISTPWVSYDPTAGEDKALYTLYQQYSFGLGEHLTSNKRITQKFLLPVEIVLKALERLGGTFESTTKLAGFKYLSKRMEDQGKVGFYTHNYIGTPNYLEGGSMKEIDNNVWVFSNVIIQGLRSDAELLRNPKSRGAWMFESFLQSGMWKLLMLIGASGLLGKAIKDGYDDMTEYHKTNFLSFPLVTLSSGKTLYFTIPQDETNRLAGAIIWKIGSALQGKLAKPQQVLDIGAGFAPSLTPIFEIVGAWFEYLRTGNAWDSYYGRAVLDQKTEQIGGVEAAKKMGLWTINNVGLGNFATYDPKTKTTSEKLIQYTPLINRMFKVSDYGVTEKEVEIEKKEKQVRAVQNKKESDLVSRQVDKYLELGGNPEDYKRGIKTELYPEGIKTIEDKENLMRLRKNFDQEISRIQGDVRVKTIMRLQLNTSKVDALKRYSKEMEPAEYRNLLNDLLKAKIISTNVYYKAK